MDRAERPCFLTTTLVILFPFFFHPNKRGKKKSRMNNQSRGQKTMPFFSIERRDFFRSIEQPLNRLKSQSNQIFFLLFYFYNLPSLAWEGPRDFTHTQPPTFIYLDLKNDKPTLYIQDRAERHCFLTTALVIHSTFLLPSFIRSEEKSGKE